MKYLNILYLTLSSLTLCSQSNNYQYDEKGRQIADYAEEIASINWNNQDLITHITRLPGSTKSDMEFGYTADGKKRYSLIKPRDISGPLPEHYWTYIYYSYDSYGNLIATYEKNYTSTNETFTEVLTLQEQKLESSNSFFSIRNQPLIQQNFTADLNQNGNFINVANSVISVPSYSSNEPIDTYRGKKKYGLQDNQHNIAIVTNDRKKYDDANVQSTEVSSATDYYPYGMIMSNRQINSESFGYGFANKKKEEALKGPGNSYDFDARMYDPRLGKWLSIDPSFGKYPFQSPYHYANNSPLSFYDPDGKDALITRIRNKDGKGGTIVIKATFLLARIDETFKKNAMNSLNAFYSPKDWTDPMTGEKWKITFDLEVMSTLDYIRSDFYKKVVKYQKRPLRDFDNHIWGGDGQNGPDRVDAKHITPEINLSTFFNEDGEIDPSEEFTLLHEIGHHLGLVDRYWERDPELAIKNDRHTKETREDLNEGRGQNELMAYDDFQSIPHSPLRMDAAHLDAWAYYIIYREESEALIKTGNHIDVWRGKIATPYLSEGYLRGRSAYWSIKKGEYLRQQRQQSVSPSNK